MKRFAIALLLAGASYPATAAVFFNNVTGLTGSFTTVDLTTPALAAGTVVTNQYAPQGINFLNATYDPQAGIYAGPSIGNFANGVGINPNISFLFGSGVSAVGFRYVSNFGVSLFEAYLGATLVASQNFTTTVDVSQFYGATGGGFDRIVITPPGNNAMLSKDFQIAAGVPEPASWAMLIAGFGLVGAAARRRRVRTVTC